MACSTIVSPTAADRSPHGERRQSPRLLVQGQLRAALLALDAAVDVRDIGRHGFSIEAMFPIATGSCHAVRFMLRSGRTVLASAIAVHGRRLARPGRPIAFVTGFEFLHADSRLTQHIVDTIYAELETV